MHIDPVLSPDDLVLVKNAAAACLNAYAKYSGFAVGSAVRTSTGHIYLGANVENVSYPVGTCAERNAIAAAVAAEGPNVRITCITVVARSKGADAACSPCGACRQAILEFGLDATVIYRGSDLLMRQTNARALLPMPFE
jgi:cytidine deaminase